MTCEVIILKVSRGLFKNFTYLGVDRVEGESFLVDPAWEADQIEHALRLSRSRCQFILLTHAHPDHVDLADALATRLRVSVYMSRREIERYGFRCRNLKPLDESSRLSIGQSMVTPISTPGHTFGSMCFRFEDHLFTGDTLFAEGCGMCLGEGADPADLFHSIQRLKGLISPETKIFPGHSYGQPPGQTFSRLLDNNIYLQFDNEEGFIAYRMRSGQTGWANFM